MSAYRMEIGWAVDAQLGMLREELLKIDDLELMKDSLIRTSIASAPVDESLFDSLVLFYCGGGRWDVASQRGDDGVLLSSRGQGV